MTRSCWWLVNFASRALEHGDRDAVRGDIAESCESGRQALCDVLDLLCRRQLELWLHGRPWLVLAGLTIPLALLLSLISFRVASQSSIYFWMYLNNWDWALLRHRAFWMILAEAIAFLLPHFLALVCLSWTLGLGFGALSRCSTAVNGALFCLVSLFAEFMALPPGRQLHDNAMSALAFYRVVFPLLMLIVLVLLPSCWGMYKGIKTSALHAVLWVPALATMAVFAAMQGLWWVGLPAHNWGWLARGWPLPPMLLIFAGPAIYAVAASWRRWQTTA